MNEFQMFFKFREIFLKNFRVCYGTWKVIKWPLNYPHIFKLISYKRKEALISIVKFLCEIDFGGFYKPLTNKKMELSAKHKFSFTLL